VLGDLGDLFTEPFEKAFHGVDEGGSHGGREHEGTRRFGVIEVVDIDDVARGGTREPLGVTDHVFFDHDLGLGGDEDVETRLTGTESKVDGAAGDGRNELEESRAFTRRFGEQGGLDVECNGFDGDTARIAAKGRKRRVGRRGGRGTLVGRRHGFDVVPLCASRRPSLR
jgi:hypothetical protein